MRLTIVTHDHPWPVTHGGRVDMWSRLTELKRRGNSIQLLSWGADSPIAEDRAVMAAACDEAFFFKPKTSFTRFLNPYFPGTVCNRMWQAAALSDVAVEVRKFKPDILLADGSMVAGAAVQLIRALKHPIPFLIRSHNIEFEHCRLLGRSETRLLRRAAYALEAHRYRGFERHILRRADHVYHSAYDDFLYWQAQGYTNQSWLAPIISPPPPAPAAASKQFDVVYLGNLRSPHKLASILWFLQKVRPRLDPSLRIAIGGADQPAHFEAVCRRHGCEYVEGIKNSGGFIGQGKVLINPVRESCGLNIKVAEMLYAGAPLVSTNAGIRGYPDEFRQLIRVADTAEEFATAIENALGAGPTQSAETLLARTFGPQTLDPFLAKASELIRLFARRAS